MVREAKKIVRIPYFLELAYDKIAKAKSEKILSLFRSEIEGFVYMGHTYWLMGMDIYLGLQIDPIQDICINRWRP